MRYFIILSLVFSALACAQSKKYVSNTKMNRNIAQNHPDTKAEVILLSASEGRSDHYIKVVFDYKILINPSAEIKQGIIKRLYESIDFQCEKITKEMPPKPGLNSYYDLDYTGLIIGKLSSSIAGVCEVNFH